MVRRRDIGLVVLRIALEPQEIVIPAVRYARIFPAHRGPSIVDRAAPRLDIEELADLAVILVLLPAHDALIAVAGFQIFLLGGLGCQPEIFGEPCEIALVDRDRRI